MQKLAVAAFLSLSLIAIDTAQSATFNVTNTNATGAGSFRQAMIDANASLDASNTIQVDSGLSGTITPQFISSDLPLIESQQLTINGPGADLLTLDLTSLQRLTLESGVTQLQINDLAISGGTAFRGGCLNSEHGAELLMSGVIFENCTAVTTNTTENARGGAIYSTGMLVLQDSTLKDNQALGGVDAGAEGGAIYIAPLAGGVTLTIRRSLVNGNDASSDKNGASVLGGAIRVTGNVNTVIEDSGFTGNRTVLTGTGSSGDGGAISGLFSQLTLRRNLFYANSSAGSASVISIGASNPADRSPTDIENNTFYFNDGNRNGVVNNGAAIFLNRSALRMRNNSFRDNKTSIGGGSLHYGGDIDLISVSNNAFDIDSQDGSQSCSISFGVTPDASFTGMFNYFTDDSCTFIAGAGTQHPTLRLEATTFPANATAFTLIPKGPSPLIDGGATAVSDTDWTLCPLKDQVGFPRPLDSDGDGDARCTAGAGETAFILPSVIFNDGFEDPGIL